MGNRVLHVHEPLVSGINIGLLQSDSHRERCFGVHELALHPSVEMTLCVPLMNDV